MAKTQRIGVYLRSALETFYFDTPSNQVALINPYTESLLESALELEGQIKLSLLQSMLTNKKIYRWPDFGVEVKLNNIKELRKVLGRDGAQAFRPLPIDTKNAPLFKPYELQLATVDLPKLLTAEWLITNETTVNTGKAVKTKLDAGVAMLSPLVPEVKSGFWQSNPLSISVTEALQDHCLNKFGWSITFKEEVSSSIYMYIPDVRKQAIFMLLLCMKSNSKVAKQEDMRRFAQWHNTINYFWIANMTTTTALITSLFTDVTPMQYNESATLPIIFSMSDGNKERFIYGSLLSASLSCDSLISLRASHVVLQKCRTTVSNGPSKERVPSGIFTTSPGSGTSIKKNDGERN